MESSENLRREMRDIFARLAPAVVIVLAPTLAIGTHSVPIWGAGTSTRRRAAFSPFQVEYSAISALPSRNYFPFPVPGHSYSHVSGGGHPLAKLTFVPGSPSLPDSTGEK